MAEMHRVGQDVGVGQGASIPSWMECDSLPNLHMFTNLKSLQTLSSWGFMAVLLHWHDLLNHWPLVIKLKLLPLSTALGWMGG